MPIRKLPEAEPTAVATVAMIEIEVRDYLQLVARDASASSALGRGKTKLRNLLLEWYKAKGYSLDTVIEVENKIVSYGAAVHDIIDPEKWFDLYNDGTINREQFLAAIKVNKEDAALQAGADICKRITVATVGDKADIRVKASDLASATFSIVQPKAKQAAPVPKSKLPAKGPLPVPASITRKLKMPK